MHRWSILVLSAIAFSQGAVCLAADRAPVSFELDVLPILTRQGCNAGACHGKARGQNGFQLSLLSFDADFDYAAITQEARGRRLFPESPEQSLLLKKPTGQVPHGGGKRLEVGSESYIKLLHWIEAGSPRHANDEPQIRQLTVAPQDAILTPQAERSLVVTAHYSNGTTRDVTGMAQFQSSESAVVAVSNEGRVKAGPIPGEAAVMARYMNQFAICTITIPLAGKPAGAAYSHFKERNFIDRLAKAKWERLGLAPSEPANDATFLRRAFLDVIGRLPNPDETRTFLADNAADKRDRLVVSLLERPEYADYWANKWADLLRPNPYRVGIKAVFNLDSWLRSAFRANMPYDQFVREILTAQGSTFQENAAVVFRDRREPEELTTIVSQLFLGIRLECAKCHHHPFEIWSQDDFYSFAAHFAQVGRKGTGLSPPISGSEEIVFAGKRGEVKHPVTGKTLGPRPLFGASTVAADGDARKALANWIASDKNPFFAKVMVNRVWADLMGRGLVDPVDDLRATNPPSNGPLLDALAKEFVDQRYDLKKLLRTIMTSSLYALQSTPNDRNIADTRNYSRHYRQRLRAEVLLDAVSDITGVPEKFTALPTGSRAMDLWTHRAQSTFLDSFGRPDPNQDPPCERTSETSAVQALHVMNSPGVHRKVTGDEGRAAQLAASKRTDGEIIADLYVLVYSREPNADEVRNARRYFGVSGSSRRQAVEDLLWAMLNTPEFWFKD